MALQKTQQSEVTICQKKRVDDIISWLVRIENSELPITDFFQKNDVPFSRAQYYVYSKQFKEYGKNGIVDKRTKGGNRKVTIEIEAFIAGCIVSNPKTSLKWLQRELLDRYECKLSPSGITRIIQRIEPDKEKRPKGRPKTQQTKKQRNSCGGFELIIALAFHLEWPQMVGKTIHDIVMGIKASDTFQASNNLADKEGRNAQGRFTKSYNQREDVRRDRFETISIKRQKKNWKSMNIMRDGPKTIERKSLAILSLPVITMNGNIKTVNCALGQELEHLAGYDYKQSSIVKYLNEIKYLGISEELLKKMIVFWRKCWGDEIDAVSEQSMLCFYIDGNTKAVWSSKRVKKNKVTMLGRVMGCLEQVFIHDCFGHPIYFETHSGHAPNGESILELFEKVEESIEDAPKARTSVCRALVMDGASNGVKALRAFASQDKYHYITPLDHNQWDERKVNYIGPTNRYKYGDATLQEVEIDLEDSNEKGYLLRSRAIKVDWDNGKMVVLLTSIPKKIVECSEVVRCYFERWPAEELQFRSMKATVSLNKVAGYGKQKEKDEGVLKRQDHAAKMIFRLQAELKEPLEDIRMHEEAITCLIPEERRLRNQSVITDGARKLSLEKMEEFKKIGKQIRSHENAIKKIEKVHKDKFRLLRNHQREWLRLQGKEIVYKVDVELDQIITFHRASLANLYAYFIKFFLDGHSMSMVNLMHRIINLGATIEESDDTRTIILDYNKKDSVMMSKLNAALEKINNLNVIGPQGKRMVFELCTGCLN